MYIHVTAVGFKPAQFSVTSLRLLSSSLALCVFSYLHRHGGFSSHRAQPLRPSVEPLALVLLPAAVERESDHDQHHEAQHGEEQREEELDAAHPFILDFNCGGTHKHVRDSVTASVALKAAADH